MKSGILGKFILALLLALFTGVTQAQTTSYANTGGTGNRTSLIAITVSSSASGFWASPPFSNIVDGSGISNSSMYPGMPLDNTAAWLQFDFGSGSSQCIQQVHFNFGSPGTGSIGSWQWYGSNDGFTFSPAGSVFSMSVSGSSVVITDNSMSANTSGFRYYRLTGTGGASTTGNNGFWRTDFKLVAWPASTWTDPGSTNVKSGTTYQTLAITASGTTATTQTGSLSGGTSGAVIKFTGDATTISSGTLTLTGSNAMLTGGGTAGVLFGGTVWSGSNLVVGSGTGNIGGTKITPSFYPHYPR